MSKQTSRRLLSLASTNEVDSEIHVFTKPVTFNCDSWNLEPITPKFIQLKLFQMCVVYFCWQIDWLTNSLPGRFSALPHKLHSEIQKSWRKYKKSNECLNTHAQLKMFVLLISTNFRFKKNDLCIIEGSCFHEQNYNNFDNKTNLI